jgi:hypothetical protein
MMHALTGVNALLKMFYTTKGIIGNCPKMNRLDFSITLCEPCVISLRTLAFKKVDYTGCKKLEHIRGKSDDYMQYWHHGL